MSDKDEILKALNKCREAQQKQKELRKYTQQQYQIKKYYEKKEKTNCR